VVDEVKPRDEDIVQKLYHVLQEDARALSKKQEHRGLAIIEAAGGVLSPGPSGTPQADILRSLRLPTVLVGDHRLGGIAATISAAESLLIRGYDINAVVCFDDHSKYENAAYLKHYFAKMGVPTFAIPWIPNLDGIGPGTKEEKSIMQGYYSTQSQGSSTENVAKRIIDGHAQRLSNLNTMASRTKEAIWHPFTQHKHIKDAEEILVFDSAHGDYFQVLDTSSEKAVDPIIVPAFDGSASWWTQGIGHGNPKLALAAAHAAGRYGHVMFAGATHWPALTLAENMLKHLDNPRLKKVFYTDNGSTATEVGIKMGLRAACKRYGWGLKDNVGVLGLKGSYHGDTIGAMDASEPCVFNEKVDWYRGRGYWFDYPTFKMDRGRWVVEPPAGMADDFGPPPYFEHQDDIFDLKTRGRAPRYEKYIEWTLNRLINKEGMKFGALIMEPVVLGAGGMIFVDPLFQQSLVRVIRRWKFAEPQEDLSPSEKDEHAWSGLPIVFDEVFTGLNRLGRFSSASFLDVQPDISVHAKLLTGGLLPLSITTASDSIFKAFWGDTKSEALLHGHSYTAHAVGCHVANVSLDLMEEAKSSAHWRDYQNDWRMVNEAPASTKSTMSVTKINGPPACWSMWSSAFVRGVSNHEQVDFVNALGSVLAVSLVDASGSGKKSSSSNISV
jgi:dethiobiotin synthetase/adenosylmethionine--8-amino-7-oxononanoate aminotransferase